MGLHNSRFETRVIDLQYPVNNGTTIFQVYINLDHRTDRRKQIEAELQRINIAPFLRFPAIKHEQGAIGCTLSHIECLKKGIQSGADHIWVFEDDFLLTISPELLQQIIQCVMETNYDVFLAGYCIKNKFNDHTYSINHSLFKKIMNAHSTHSYLVNKKYATTLLHNFEEGVKKLIKTKHEPKFALDQYWKKLQVNDMWISYAHGVCGVQRAGYSDIDKTLNPNPTKLPLME